MTEKVLSIESKKDVIELKEKIDRFKNGEIAEERFKAYRLTRGVYGQRQPDVQMFRIKLPYGKITPDQLRTVATLSEAYTNGNLHFTTRQNIQLHHIKLDDTPAIWEELEKVGVTARESCGNTVRNITGSPFAGIDPDEPFDVTPYVQEVFEYFLRNPICQDMGRKIKMAFSASEKDSAFTYIHDFGFIPRIENGVRGFKVVVGGGLGAQPFVAQVASEFIEENQLIPFIEAGLRVFDRYGERERRNKARLKYLIEPRKGLGIDKFLELLEEEKAALPYQKYEIKHKQEVDLIPVHHQVSEVKIADREAFELWKSTNVFPQKQKGYYGVKVRIPLGNISSGTAIALAGVAEKYASNDIRATVNQGLLFRFVRKADIELLYSELYLLGLVKPGFDSLADVTSCPGTDTCNLGVTNSTKLASTIETLILEEYPDLIGETNLKIKISGCMNSCGQHMIANIGFHGSSIKVGEKVAPAMQIVIGGGVDPNGNGFIAEKVIKVPTKRIPQAVRILLDDYDENQQDDELFNDYFRRLGKKYFYNLLKDLADAGSFESIDFQDWGLDREFQPEIGVGECAGVTLDLVGTVLQDAEDHLSNATVALEKSEWANAIYYAYNSLVIGAKAILLGEDIQCNTHKSIIADFHVQIYKSGKIALDTPYQELVLQINKHAPAEFFATSYVEQAGNFLREIVRYRKSTQLSLNEEKLVVSSHYKA